MLVYLPVGCENDISYKLKCCAGHDFRYVHCWGSGKEAGFEKDVLQPVLPDLAWNDCTAVRVNGRYSSIRNNDAIG